MWLSVSAWPRPSITPRVITTGAVEVFGRPIVDDKPDIEATFCVARYTARTSSASANPSHRQPAHPRSAATANNSCAPTLSLLVVASFAWPGSRSAMNSSFASGCSMAETPI